MDIHYYMLCYRSEALIASHLEPEAFGLYMSVGTQKNTRGNVIFFEIDPGLRSDYFKLGDIETRCVPYPDGSPKRSKYISIYRVLEHLDLAVLNQLYLSTADGRVMKLEASVYNDLEEASGANLYQELCPVTPMVVSPLSPSKFIKFMTSPDNPVHVPRLFFADLLLDRDQNGNLSGNLPYEDTAHLLDCIRVVEAGKETKTVSRTPHIHGFFRTIRRGFFVGDQTGLKFYRYPNIDELEVEHAKWWHSASESMVA